MNYSAPTQSTERQPYVGDYYLPSVGIGLLHSITTQRLTLRTRGTAVQHTNLSSKEEKNDPIMECFGFGSRGRLGNDNTITTLSFCFFVFFCCCWTIICAVPAAAFVATSNTKSKMNLGSIRHTQLPPRILSPHTISTSTPRGRPLQAEAEEGKPMPTGLRPDTQITFGSDDDNPEEDEDDYYDEEENQYIKKRDEVVQKALDEQDKEFREERRRKVWGDFADAKTAEDIEKVKQTLKEKIDKENKFKSQLAKQQGVDMEILEAPESDEGFSDNDSSDFQIRSGSGKSWYDNMDEDLKQEWAAMGEAGGDASDGEEESDEKEESSVTDDTVAIGGKIVSRDTLKGVRVGSAGGWTLEVFPGDFVVHRKYGIGRFEKTCTTPRLKLTREEVKARDARRKELITEKLREAKGGIPQDMIQKLQATFGTEDDTDPISNPQVTVLEITYADGIVHVPVDRAYRLSRYRAGNAAIKPRLSKVRGDQWRNARKKVEASTLELAQDVLALYATRETLQRQPFDPDNESQVHTFEKTFKFEPTKDQKKCFEDVENDMVWRSRPMDRLICGDVG